jgi:putative membrane protein
MLLRRLAAFALAAAVAAGASALERVDADFLAEAARTGHARIEAGKLALDKGVNTQVKGFAQQVVDDGTKAAAELTTLASAKGVELPAGATVAQKARLQVLGALDGASFDRQYTNEFGVKAHREAVRLFQKAATSGRDPDVRAFAARMLRVVEHQFAIAMELKGVVDKEGNAKAAKDRKQ